MLRDAFTRIQLDRHTAAVPLARKPHAHSSPPRVTMPADLVDKIYIGYNAPYALGNMLAPQCVPAPVVSPRKYPDRQSASV